MVFNRYTVEQHILREGIKQPLAAVKDNNNNNNNT